MKPIIVDISDMTDSREMYESKVSGAGVAFVFTMLGLVVVAIIWMCIGKLDVYVNADGVIKPSDSVSTVTNIRQGVVEKVLYKPSDIVDKGDTLYIIEHSEYLAKKDYYSEQIAITEEETNALKAYIKAVSDNEPKLDDLGASGIALRYKTQYDAFGIKVRSLINEYETTEKSISAEIDHVRKQLRKNEEDLAGYAWLHSKVADEDFDKALDPAAFFALQYDDYLSRRAELFSAVQSRKRLYEMNILLEGEAVSTYDVEEAKKAYENSLLAYENQKTVFILDIETRKKALLEEKKNLDKTLSDLEIKKEQLGVSETSKYRYLAVEKTVKDELSSALQLLETKEKVLTDLKNGLSDTENAIKECTVRSPANGVIHEVSTPVEGDFLASGIVVLNVLPENEEEYKAIVYLNNADRGNVEAGMGVKLNIASFPSAEYGYFTGKLTDVAKDITVDQRSGRAFYRADAYINIDTTIDKEGNRLPLESGMACEVKIITGEKTIMRWVLEKLSLLVKG